MGILLVIFACCFVVFTVTLFHKYRVLLTKHMELAQASTSLLTKHQTLTQENDCLLVKHQTLTQENDCLLTKHQTLTQENDCLLVKHQTLTQENDNLSKENIELENALIESEKLLDLVKSYEEFFQTTVIDLSDVLEAFEKIMAGRHMLSADPDVQNIYKATTLAYNIIIGYLNKNDTTQNQTPSQEEGKK
jgi:predicted nuclease with TOPRIM domain